MLQVSVFILYYRFVWDSIKIYRLRPTSSRVEGMERHMSCYETKICGIYSPQ